MCSRGTRRARRTSRRSGFRSMRRSSSFTGRRARRHGGLPGLPATDRRPLGTRRLCCAVPSRSSRHAVTWRDRAPSGLSRGAADHVRPHTEEALTPRVHHFTDRPCAGARERPCAGPSFLREVSVRQHLERAAKGGHEIIVLERYRVHTRPLEGHPDGSPAIRADRR